MVGKNKMSNIKKILIFFSLIIFLYSSINLGRYIFDFYKVKNEIKKLESNISTSDNKFKELYNQNSDIIGWLKIENTLINYPVMYTPQDPEFYLTHNFEKQESRSGLPFLDYRCSIKKPTTNLIIYGHNMKNGSMFNTLMKYKDEGYYKNYPIIQFDTTLENGKYEIISVFLSKVYKKNEDVFKYYQFVQANNKLEFDNFIKNIKKLSIYDIQESAKYGDKLLTLSTCEYSDEDSRLVVVARKK